MDLGGVVRLVICKDKSTGDVWLVVGESGEDTAKKTIQARFKGSIKCRELVLPGGYPYYFRVKTGRPKQSVTLFL